MANTTCTSADLNLEKHRKQLIMQNALLYKARKRRAMKETETNQPVSFKLFSLFL
jgi:hypothetical protein